MTSNADENARLRALLSWIDGACVDRLPHDEIAAAIGRWQQEPAPPMPKRPEPGREWVLQVEGVAFTHNELTAMHYRTRAAFVKVWRILGRQAAQKAAIPALDRVEVHATSHFASSRRRRDVAADAPTAKAVLDGVQDAGVVVNDGPDHVRAIVFHRPVFDGTDLFELRIREVST